MFPKNIFHIFNGNNDKEQVGVSKEENLKEYLRNFHFLGRVDKNESTLHYLKFIANGIQAELNLNYYFNDRTYLRLLEHIKYSFVLDLSPDSIKTYNKEVNISNTPVISMVWKNSLGECISRIGKCNDNPFCRDRADNNVLGILIDPIGLVFVYGGNHSVNSAIVHNEGSILVNEYVDITPMIDKYRFDGTRFVSIKNGAPIVNDQLLNKSMPFTYSMGVMFEFGRIINENKNKI